MFSFHGRNITVSKPSFTTCSVRPTIGIHQFYRRYLGFGFILLSKEVLSRQLAATADR